MGFRRDEPPIKTTRIFTHGEWWGAEHALVKSPRPEFFVHSVEEKAAEIQHVIDTALAQMPGAPVQLGGRYRISASIGARRLKLVPDRAVDADFLDWAEAEVSPDHWEQFTVDNGTVSIVGVKDGEPVALIASRTA
jgi:hypothetical protein